MPSIPLKHPADLTPYVGLDTKAHLTIFYNTPAKANENLVVVFGTNSFGGVGELAHLRLSEDLFGILTDLYPLTTEKGLTRSPDIEVERVQGMLIPLWPPAPEPASEPS